MKWFKHDSNAHTDAKLQKVLMRYGADGYATYWYCLELIAGKVDAKNITFELEHDAEIIGHVLKVDQLRVQEIMTYMTKLGLFDNTEGVITCLKMATRLDDTTSRHPLIKQILNKINGAKGLEGSASDNPEGSSDNPEVSPTKSEQKRLEEKRKEDIKKKKKKKKPWVGLQPPSINEVQKYLDAEGITDFTAEKFVSHYESVEWMRGRTQITCWHNCVGTWRKGAPKKPKSLEVID